jgi:hypothetical protein
MSPKPEGKQRLSERAPPPGELIAPPNQGALKPQSHYCFGGASGAGAAAP